MEPPDGWGFQDQGGVFGVFKVSFINLTPDPAPLLPTLLCIGDAARGRGERKNWGTDFNNILRRRLLILDNRLKK
jgi:hypothetical protein